ncbi:MAG: flavodoxin family protein [Bacteroidales bacterium]|nr:flavodoxin family protein [Bacteroidales bacterium]
MKVIIINGSPKANGNTATALHEAEGILQQHGIETEWIHVGHKQIHGCIACNNCWDTGICAFNDIVNEISNKMREADGLLIGSPVYFASPNGTLISLLDRLFYSNLHTDWTMKVGASVSIARRGGATATMDVLNKYFLKTNMPVVPSQYWSIVHGTDPGEVTQDLEGMQTMRQLAHNMAFLIKSIHLGMEQFGSPKIKEPLVETHYIR